MGLILCQSYQLYLALSEIVSQVFFVLHFLILVLLKASDVNKVSGVSGQ